MICFEHENEVLYVSVPQKVSEILKYRCPNLMILLVNLSFCGKNRAFLGKFLVIFWLHDNVWYSITADLRKEKQMANISKKDRQFET